jgi:hypothetical protein
MNKKLHKSTISQKKWPNIAGGCSPLGQILSVSIKTGSQNSDPSLQGGCSPQGPYIARTTAFYNLDNVHERTERMCKNMMYIDAVKTVNTRLNFKSIT